MSIAIEFPCPWSEFVLGHRDSDATASKVAGDIFLGDVVDGAHVWDMVDLGRDAEGASPEDILVSS